MSQNRLPYLIFLMAIPIVFIGLFVLASGLSQLEIQTDGQLSDRIQFSLPTPVAISETSEAKESTIIVPKIPDSSPTPLFMRILLSLVLIAGFIYLLATKEGRKKLKPLVYYAVWIAALFYLLRNYVKEMLIDTFSEVDADLTTSLGQALPPTPVLLTWTISIVIALLAGVMIWRIFGRNQPPIPNNNDLINSVQQTLTRLDHGDDLRNTILECYRSMLSQAQRLHGGKRTASVTAQEFEGTLIKLGLPARETTRLTRLFEKVRYSNSTATPTERREARDCLNTFITVAQSK